MYACILDQHGEMRLHRHMPASPETLLKAMAPYREDMVVAVECVFTWTWLADLCAPQGSACVLGPALHMNAIHGGKAKHDPIDPQNMAVLLRGGLLPQAYVYPAAMRATRALLRRRVQLTRTRAALLAHVQHTNSQYHRPEIRQPLAYQANRDGVAERCADPAVQKCVKVDRALIDHDDRLLSDVEWTIVQTAKPYRAQALYRRQSVPGIGNSLRLVLL
jgi:hypothetical protein